METKFTPGPWRVGEMRNKYDIVIRDSNNSPVALGVVAGYLLREAEANARLIAAAPELLDVLTRLEMVAGLGNNYDDPVRVSARAAIAKATGAMT